MLLQHYCIAAFKNTVLWKIIALLIVVSSSYLKKKKQKQKKNTYI